MGLGGVLKTASDVNGQHAWGGVGHFGVESPENGGRGSGVGGRLSGGGGRGDCVAARCAAGGVGERGAAA